MQKNTKYIIAFCALGMSLAGSAAYAVSANDQWYTTLSGDVTWLSGRDTGGGGNVALGYRFWPSDYGDFRLEGEAGYHDDGDTHYTTYMGNLYYDFRFAQQGKWQIIPYVGGGLGDATAHFGDNDASGRFSTHDDVFAYQAMAGVAFASADMPNTEWSIGYRYLGSDDTSTVDNAGFSHSDRINASNVELAARFYF